MPIEQVDRGDDGRVRSVSAVVNAGQSAGYWCVEFCEDGRSLAEHNFGEPSWIITRYKPAHFDFDTGKPMCLLPVDAWSIAPGNVPDRPALVFELRGLIGSRLAEAIARRFDWLPDREPQPKRPPRLTLIQGGRAA